MPILITLWCGVIATFTLAHNLVHTHIALPLLPPHHASHAATVSLVVVCCMLPVVPVVLTIVGAGMGAYMLLTPTCVHTPSMKAASYKVLGDGND